MNLVASVLYLCITPTWLACADVHVVDYGTAEACQSALSTMRTDTNGLKVVGGNGKGIVAYCRPPFTEKKTP